MKPFFSTWIQRLSQSSGQKWYLPMASTFSFLDAYIPVVPNELFLALGVFPRPKRWLSIALIFALASACGATSLAAVFHHAGQWVMTSLFPDLINNSTWVETVSWMDRYGILGLGLVALSPFPQHAAVIILALAHAPFIFIFAAVFVGRFLKYGLVAWLAKMSPQTLRKVGILK
jgi:membrane protein YqaA with SNARE-associated domain